MHRPGERTSRRCGRAVQSRADGAEDGPADGRDGGALATPPDVLLLDATGRDHQRGAGLALHLGANSACPPWASPITSVDDASRCWQTAPNCFDSRSFSGSPPRTGWR